METIDLKKNSISLSKGDVISLSKSPAIDLSKGTQGLSKVLVGLGWDPVSEMPKETKKKGLFGFLRSEAMVEPVGDIDCDAFAIMMNNDGKILDDGLIYYGHKRNNDGSAYHTGDNLTGDGDGDDEQIVFNLATVKADRIIIAVNIYNGRGRNQHFGKLQNAFVRIEDMNTHQEICYYTLDSKYDNYVTVYFGELKRDVSTGEWNFQAVGEASDANSISEFAKKYGYR